MTTLREALRAPMRAWLTLTHLTVLTIPVVLLVLTGQVRAELVRQAGAELLARAPLTARLIERDLAAARAVDPSADLHAIGEETMAVARPQESEPYPVQIWLIDPQGQAIATTAGTSAPPSLSGLQTALAGRTQVASLENPHAGSLERFIAGFTPRGSVVVTTPIKADGGVVGAVVLQRRPAVVVSWIRTGMMPLTSLVVAAVFATSLLALWAADQFTRSLRVLTEEASRVADGDLEVAMALGRPTRSSVREVHALSVSVQRMATRLESRMRLLQEVASGVAHELRTPLSTLIGTVELLEDESMPAEDRRRFLARASEQLTRLRAIVDGILALSRADRPGAREVVSLDELAAELGADDVTIQGHAGPVQGDRAALRLAIDNLVRNARQHGVAPITLSAWQDGEHAGIDVIDGGPGLSPELAARVFERFYTTDRAQGLGLGLSIVAAVAEAHGGQVSLLPGAPTRFRMTLPAART